MTIRRPYVVQIDHWNPSPIFCSAVGVVRLTLPDLGISFRGVVIKRGPSGEFYARLPRQTNCKTFKSSQMMFFVKDEDYAEFSKQVVASVREEHPEAFVNSDDPAFQPKPGTMENLNA